MIGQTFAVQFNAIYYDQKNYFSLPNAYDYV